MKNVLIFTAHPDDHVIFGGTIVKLKRAGFVISEVLFTNGGRARLVGQPGVSKTKVESVRAKEFKKAQKILGITKTIKLNLEDGRVVGNLQVINRLVGLIRETQPEIMILHHDQDYHPDHLKVSEIGMEAVRVANISKLPKLGKAYRVPIVLMAEGLLPIVPDLLVEVSQEWESREAAERIYESQFTPRVDQWRESFSAKNGYVLRAAKAEGFSIPRYWPANIGRLFDI